MIFQLVLYEATSIPN